MPPFLIFMCRCYCHCHPRRRRLSCRIPSRPQPLSSCYCYCFFSSAAKAVAAAAPTTTTTRYPCATINQVTLCCVVPYGRHIPVYTSMACLWCQLVSFLSATMNERVGEARVISITIRSKSSVGMAINKFNEISVF